jgi:hypothetical protein
VFPDDVVVFPDDDAEALVCVPVDADVVLPIDPS